MNDDKEISKELDAATKALFSAFKDDNKGLIEKLSSLPENSKKEVVSDIVSKLLESSQPKQTEFKQIGIPITSLEDEIYEGYGGLFSYKSSGVDSLGRSVDPPCVKNPHTIIAKNNFGENHSGEIIPYFYVRDTYRTGSYYDGTNHHYYSNFDGYKEYPEGLVYINDKKVAVLYKFREEADGNDLRSAFEGKFVNSDDILKSFISRKLKEVGNFEEAEKLDKNRNLTVSELVEAGRGEEADITFKKHCAEAVKNGKKILYSDFLSILNYCASNDRKNEIVDINANCEKLVDVDMLNSGSYSPIDCALNDLCESGNEESAVKIYKTIREKSDVEIDSSAIAKIYISLRSKGKDVDELLSIIMEKDYSASSCIIGSLFQSGKDEDFEEAINLSKIPYSSICISDMEKMVRYLFSKDREDEIINILKFREDNHEKDQLIHRFCSSEEDEDFELAALLMKNGKYALDTRYINKYYVLDDAIKLCNYLISKDRIDEAANVILGQRDNYYECCNSRRIGIDSTIEYENRVFTILDKINEKYSPSVNQRIEMAASSHLRGKDKEAVAILMRHPKALSDVVGRLMSGKKLLELNKLLKFISEYNK